MVLSPEKSKEVILLFGIVLKSIITYNDPK